MAANEGLAQLYKKQIIMLQALIRGILVRRKMAAVREMYADLVKCIDCNPLVKIVWHTQHHMCLPRVVKSVTESNGKCDTKKNSEMRTNVNKSIQVNIVAMDTVIMSPQTVLSPQTVTDAEVIEDLEDLNEAFELNQKREKLCVNSEGEDNGINKTVHNEINIAFTNLNIDLEHANKNNCNSKSVFSGSDCCDTSISPVSVVTKDYSAVDFVTKDYVAVDVVTKDYVAVDATAGSMLCSESTGRHDDQLLDITYDDVVVDDINLAISERLSHDTSEIIRVPRDTSKRVSHYSSVRVANDTSGRVNDISERVNHDTSERVANDTSGRVNNISERVSHDTSESVSNDTSEIVCHDTSEIVCHDTSKRVCHDTSERVCHDTSERVSDSSESISCVRPDRVNRDVSDGYEVCFVTSTSDITTFNEKQVSSKQANPDGSSRPSLPRDSCKLRLIRETVVMELLWIQQAIDSRKSYLRLKSDSR